MTETSEAIQIETRVFFDKYFYKFESIAGRNHEELFPENIDNYVLTGSDDYPAKIVEADKVVYSVGKAISECEDAKRKPYRTILVKCYLKQMMNREIADDLKYSSSRYSELKANALMEFTDRFNCWLTKQDNNNPAFQLIYRKTKKQATAGNTKASSTNRPAKKAKPTAEPRSQRKQFLFTKETSVNMKALALSKGISVNEMVNEVMENYIKRQFTQHPEYKTVASTLLKVEN